MPESLRILALEPYGALSHRLFLEGLARHSRHEVVLEVLPPRKWKWRMRTASLHYAGLLEERGGEGWDLLFASDFVNLAELVALLPRGLRDLPSVIYFHENQLTYPMQETEFRDFHFTLTHVHAMLVADRVLFNSGYHLREFLGAVPEVLKLVPDIDVSGIPDRLRGRSSVLPLGTDLDRCAPRKPDGPPTLLWNHRWEYDKNPGAFLTALTELQDRGVEFRLRLLGESFRAVPREFAEMKERLEPHLDGFGFVEGRDDYVAALRGADIIVSTANHEFFGLGTLEGIRSGLFPVLPDDLAYPELLPEELRRPPYLYPRESSVADALEVALTAVTEGARLDERRRLVESTDRFVWETLVPEYDAFFEAVVAARSGSA